MWKRVVLGVVAAWLLVVGGLDLLLVHSGRVAPAVITRAGTGGAVLWQRPAGAIFFDDTVEYRFTPEQGGESREGRDGLVIINTRDPAYDPAPGSTVHVLYWPDWPGLNALHQPSRLEAGGWMALVGGMCLSLLVFLLGGHGGAPAAASPARPTRPTQPGSWYNPG